MSQFNHFVGIDISKDVFDAVLLLETENSPVHQKFDNTLKGCKSFLKWLRSFHVDPGECLVCCEHTGVYVNILVAFLTDHAVPVWLEMSYRIIRSSGIQRGKNDKVDAHRIALYASKNKENAVLFKPRKKVIIKINSIMVLRSKLIKHKAALTKTTNELKVFEKETAKVLNSLQASTIKAIDRDLQKIETKLDELINSDDNFKTRFHQVQSVPGVGRVTALLILCTTNEFTNFSSPRQLACYCGVVPFEHTSGKSIKNRPRVHYMANKQLKTALHMCALTASKNDPEINAYYTRKVNEGKARMLVINNIRNKLIHRICACVRDNRCFEKRNAA